MYISCLATDYDGTLAHDGIVDAPTADALVAFRRSGRKLLLVTGRELPDLIRVLPRIDLFDRVVAENGALLFDPATKKETPLGPEPSPELVETLRTKGVRPLSVGRSIVATWEPNEKLVPRRSVNTDLSFKSSSTRERSWCCLLASTKPAA